MPRGQTGSRLEACWVCIPRCFSCGVECLEVMEKTVCFLSMVPAGVLVGLSEDFGGWEANRYKKNQEETVLKTWNLLDKYFISMVNRLWWPESNFFKSEIRRLQRISLIKNYFGFNPLQKKTEYLRPFCILKDWSTLFVLMVLLKQSKF